MTGGVGNIRVWSIPSGLAVQRLTVGKGQNEEKDTIVWAIAVTESVLASGNIFASLHLCFMQCDAGINATVCSDWSKFACKAYWSIGDCEADWLIVNKPNAMLFEQLTCCVYTY